MTLSLAIWNGLPLAHADPGAGAGISECQVEPDAPVLSREARECNAIATSELEKLDSNALLLEAMEEMPKGGGYGTESGTRPFKLSLHAKVVDGKLKVTTRYAKPSYCTLATYLVFLKYLENLQNAGKLKLHPNVLEKLRLARVPDGTGIWGRWNANGPGIPVVARRLGIATNFTDADTARAGDFIKIFWRQPKRVAGNKEHGHAAIFLKKTVENGTEYVYFWSSNQKRKNTRGGYGIRRVPASQIQHAIFTRFKSPAEVERGLNENVPKLPDVDPYLKKLASGNSTLDEANRRSGVSTFAAEAVAGKDD